MLRIIDFRRQLDDRLVYLMILNQFRMLHEMKGLSVKELIVAYFE
jgi:hypothetical protein